MIIGQLEIGQRTNGLLACMDDRTKSENLQEETLKNGPGFRAEKRETGDSGSGRFGEPFDQLDKHIGRMSPAQDIVVIKSKIGDTPDPP